MSKRQLFKKKNGTGMHVVRDFSEGTLINNDPVQGRQILRPGNTVLCYPEELGVDGMRQFDSLSPASETDSPDAPSGGLIIVSPSKGWYDVINPQNPSKPFNKKKLRKKAADDLLAMLTEGEADPDDDGLDALEWDDLVKKLEDAGVEWDDAWENDDDLRVVLRGLNA